MLKDTRPRDINDKTCGKEIKCYDYLIRKCVRSMGHKGGCNPFSTEVLSTEIVTKQNVNLFGDPIQ